MGTYLELHKRADKSGEEPAEGEAWPLSHVELLSDPPQSHFFSTDYVDRESKAGWLEFAGNPVSFEVTPDPLGDFKQANPMTITLPGNRLVLRVVRDAEPVQVVYRITKPPVPTGFRMDDPDEPMGLRTAKQYDVELEA